MKNVDNVEKVEKQDRPFENPRTVRQAVAGMKSGYPQEKMWTMWKRLKNTKNETEIEKIRGKIALTFCEYPDSGVDFYTVKR